MEEMKRERERKNADEELNYRIFKQLGEVSFNIFSEGLN